MQNVKSLEGLTSDETRTAEGFVIFSFRKWWRHMKTKNINEHKHEEINNNIYFNNKDRKDVVNSLWLDTKHNVIQSDSCYSWQFYHT